MRFLLLTFFFLLTVQWINAANPYGVDIDDNDFAEFEDFDDEGKFIAAGALQTPGRSFTFMIAVTIDVPQWVRKIWISDC